jgi:hypothetical protein
MRGVFIVTSAFMLTTSVITVLQELSMKRK